MKTMTVAAVRKAAAKHKYLVLRTVNNRKQACNTKIIDLGDRNPKAHGNQLTAYIGWLPVSLNEYINAKRPNEFYYIKH